jgi:type I restriction enzyme S subunit
MTWQSVPLESVAEIQLGKMLSGKASKGESPAPYLRNANVQWGRLVLDDLLEMDFSHREREKFSLIPGDLIVCEGGEPGRCAVVTEPMRNIYYQKALMRVRPQPERLTPQFLQRFMQHAASRGVFRQGGNQSTIAHFPAVRLRALQVPLPPLLEQKRIAAIIDAADALRAKRRESIEQLDSLVQATFLEMFGDPVTNPKGWAVKPLNDMAVAIMSGNTPKGGEEVYVKEGITFFRSQNVWKNRIELDDIAYIDSDTHRRMKKSSLRNKDILMTKTGRINTEHSSLGRAALFLGPDDSANINGHVYLIRLRKGCVHEFVLRILTTRAYRDYIRGVCVGGIDKRQINKSHIESFPIISPPSELQTRFASIVESIEQQKARLKVHLAELDTLFASVQSRAFNGDLVA